MKIDFHTHSKYSPDALTKPKTMIKAAKKLGIGFVITDHNNIKAWSELNKLAKKHEVTFIQGQELYTFHQGKFAGEFLCSFLTDQIKSKEYLDILDEVKTQDGIVGVSHPFDVFRKNFKYLEKEWKKLDVIEVFNSRCYLARFNSQAKDFAEKHSMNRIAGSDAHTPWEIGRAYTEIGASDLEEFRKKLLKNKAKIHGVRSDYSVHLWTQLVKLKIAKER